MTKYPIILDNRSLLIVSVICTAFSMRLSPMTIFMPYPMRRAIAMPICPAPVGIITSIMYLVLKFVYR